MSRMGARRCDRCDCDLGPATQKVVPVGDPSPYILLCWPCWNAIEQERITQNCAHLKTKECEGWIECAGCGKVLLP